MPENIPGCMFLFLFIFRQDSLNDETRQKIVSGVYRKVIGNWLTADLENYGTTSSDVMKTKRKYLGFLQMNLFLHRIMHRS